MKGFKKKPESKNDEASNKKTILSREEIIDQAFQFHSQGNISEAAKYYQQLINKGFREAFIFLIMESF